MLIFIKESRFFCIIKFMYYGRLQIFFELYNLKILCCLNIYIEAINLKISHIYLITLITFMHAKLDKGC